MTQTYGTLYGIGVGPGAPDLLTLRAARVLGGVDTVLAAASPRNGESLALSIARPHLAPGSNVLRLDFPMTRDEDVLQKAWEKNAEITADLLRSGKSAAFLTLGDPLVYSTFGYLMRTLEALHPELPVEVVPGITSFQEAAAKSRTVLCEGEENLCVLSGINAEARLAGILEGPDSAVILKVYRNSGAVYAAVAGAGRGEEAVFASRLGLEGECLERGLERAPQEPAYLSLMLAPPKRGR